MFPKSTLRPVLRNAFSFFFRSVPGRLTLVVAAVLGSAALLVGWLIRQGYQNERRTLERHLSGAARSTALIVEGELRKRIALLQGLSVSGNLQRGHWAGFRAQASDVVRGPDEWIVLIDETGQQLVNTLIGSDQPLPRTELDPDFAEARGRGEPFISDLVLGDIAQAYLVYVAIAVRRGDRMLTLACAMKPSVFSRAMAEGGAERDWLVTIVDRDDFIVARSRSGDQFVGRQVSAMMAEAMGRRADGVVESVTLDGVKSLTGFSRSLPSGWRFVAAAPAENLYASARALLKVSLAVSLILGAAAALVALRVGRGISRAVQMLVADTEAIGRGEPAGGARTGFKETDLVASSLLETSRRLAARESELKRLNDHLATVVRELGEKKGRLEAAAKAGSIATFVWHPGRDAFESDEALHTLLELPAAQPLSKIGEFLALVDPEDRATVERALSQAQQQPHEFAAEFRVPASTGSSRWLLARGGVFPLSDGTGAYMAAACVDITERRRSEAEIARARDAAVAAGRAKDEFLAALSHELRTPLNPVLLIATDSADREEFPAEAREAFAQIAKNAMLEARLIDDLLDLTRISRGKMALEMQATDLHTVVREAIATVRAELQEKQQVLVQEFYPEPAPVIGDPTRLQQVFWNLLKNAVKFTPRGGQIVVRTRRMEQCIEISVTDTGWGMTPAEIARSFQSFSQGDHAVGGAHRFGGLGLGLAISRMLVEYHGGKIAVASPGRNLGATFTVTLPLSDGAVAPGAGADGASGGNFRNAGEVTRLLLVEDHESSRLTVERVLRRRGYEVHAATNAAEALLLAEQYRFDLLISDIGLPDGDGYSLMTALRDRHGLMGVALTGYGMEDDVARAKAAGFVAHLTKPLNLEALDAALATIAAKRHEAQTSS